MRAFLAALFISGVLATGVLHAAGSSVTITLESPKASAKVDKVESLPTTLEVGKTVVVDQSLEQNFSTLFKANMDSDNGSCQAHCPHEVGGIVCPVGKTAACGCPGGYLSCGCR